ncbi:type IV pilus assembly protein PilB [Methylomarinovum caldicuralii]|uniref:Type IV pilus assembly protein PilB n=1 Tax=Methylomarinovum caldicuralii TaxID=438856 RepID=A0AAU9C9P6_9GAMM|nr:ATPase, T2SS/T4P/T4SS family [Methylomarinovum caldicuralii]BCX82754.1 type IV pilus assembly protein PilB [Methylomarinovum caldicuralii]
MATPSERLRNDDQRQNPRQPALPAWHAALYPPGADSVEGRIVDLSDRGAGLAVAEARLDGLHEGAQVTLTLEAGERRFTRRAEIRWLRIQDDGGLRLGLRFIDPVCFDPADHVLDMDEVRIHPECVLKIPATLAMRRRVLPFVELDGVLHVACTDPGHRSTLRIVERMAKTRVCAWKAEKEPLERAIRRVCGDGRDRLSALSAPSQNALQGLDADATDVTDEILFAAYLKQASDVHIDPRREGVVVRFRVDGRLETHAMLPANAHSEIIGRLKVLAGMDIAEKRAPQDGSFSKQFVSGGREIDVRVATLPTRYGERMTLRLLALQTGSLTLDKLGLSDFHRQTVETFLRRNQGMMLLTGPTGSGKTTTLYAAIRRLLAERDLNIITVEDPVEYEIDGVAQSEVDSADKVSFAKALRSILRHDPDVVMIGEIRDHETADVAIKAALTGHLVLSTLHTNSAPATLTRLIDMGLEPYLVAASVRLAIAQRLVRRLCRHCRIPRPLTRREAEVFQRPELAGQEVYEGAGCIYCGGRGYNGRLAVYEMLPIDAEWARGIAEGAGEAEVIQWMQEAGVPFLVDDVLDKVLAGKTSVSEAMGIVLSW